MATNVSMTQVTIALLVSAAEYVYDSGLGRQEGRAGHFLEGGAMKVSYEDWRDDLLLSWPDAQIVRGYPVVLARSMGMVVGEWSHSWMFWVKTPSYKSACLDAQQEQQFGIWDQTIGGIGKRA